MTVFFTSIIQALNHSKIKIAQNVHPWGSTNLLCYIPCEHTKRLGDSFGIQLHSLLEAKMLIMFALSSYKNQYDCNSMQHFFKMKRNWVQFLKEIFWPYEAAQSLALFSVYFRVVCLQGVCCVIVGLCVCSCACSLILQLRSDSGLDSIFILLW